MQQTIAPTSRFPLESLLARDEVTVSVKDQDMAEHDQVASLTGKVPARLPGGTWVLGNGALRLDGICSQ